MSLRPAAPAVPFTLAVLGVLAALPLLSAWSDPGAALADPLSELPVKLWMFESVPILGGRADSIGWPNGGPLNNADPVGTAVTAVLRPILGRSGAFNALIWAQTFANLTAAWLLASRFVADRAAAVFGAAAFALTPIVLVYGVAGAVTDVLSLWPYPLAIRALFDAIDAGDRRGGALAGALGALGFVTCPYNFVVFAALLVPAGAITLWRTRQAAAGALRRLVGVCAAAGLLGGALAGGWAAHMWSITEARDSQMSTTHIRDTRHTPPYDDLRPAHPGRYTAYLVDYVAVGKAGLVQRQTGSRYLRAFSPGLVLLGVAAFACVGAARRRAVHWVVAAGFCVLASTGPFLPVTRDLAATVPINVVWRLVHDGLPGGAWILEPFRYALPAALALAVAGALGADALATRFGSGASALVVQAWLLELAFLSPVPVPLPTAGVVIPAEYAALDALVGPGALLELPYFDRGTDRFRRVHFLNQLAHGRPIADEVIGFPARYLRENQYAASLLAAEKDAGPLAVTVADPSRVDADRARLAADGFAAVVVTPSAYRSPEQRDAALALLAPFGEPTRLGDVLVYRLR